jgi:small subunit ribosomal protein S5
MSNKVHFKKGNKPNERPEFEQYILDMARVTRVTKGGKQLSFRVCVILGDRRGRVGYGVAKGADVQLSVEKAVHQAKKNIIKIPLVNETIPHRIVKKFKSATVMLKPAPKGSGIIAGGAARVVLDLAGVPNVSCKNLGKTKNKIVTVKATFEALKSFKGASFVSPVEVKELQVAPVEIVTEEQKKEEKIAVKPKAVKNKEKE